MFKRMPKERQLRVRHVHEILSLGILFIKNDVNLKLGLSVKQTFSKEQLTEMLLVLVLL